MQVGSPEWCMYLLDLEKERLGSSTTPRVSKKLMDSEKVSKARWEYQQELEQLWAIREQRDKIFFNAGRFMAGDRDDVAVAAFKLCNVLMLEER
jgi:hypothetical protein